jgi:mRNA-degrading endonuclease RelE of RelBE toxin-antitoxin system
LALRIELSNTAAKYLSSLDRSTQSRIVAKLDAIAAEPRNPRLAKPLTGAEQRTARVGDYRITFSIADSRGNTGLAIEAPRINKGTSFEKRELKKVRPARCEPASVQITTEQSRPILQGYSSSPDGIR